uniref:Succinate dehydrogenase subunit 4 n=1 Tax=Periphykon beckeri TaxID=2006982 RepID=UPI0022FD50F0|nr:Succinate dehydrogenase subunit 4 [Periphykon beckeri]WAX04148.1 Succinate dehydrogenase subunit 4 [Periphykon beckeri]
MSFQFNHFLFLLFYTISIFLDFEFFLFFLNFIMLHIFLGLNAIFKDYVHQKEINFFFIFYVRLVFLLILNVFIELFF